MWWASTPCTTMIWIWLKVDLSKENSRKKSSRKKINRFDNKISHFLAWLVNSILKGGGPGYVAGLMEVDVVWTIVNCQEKKLRFFPVKIWQKCMFLFIYGKSRGICFDFDLIFKTLEKTKGQFEWVNERSVFKHFFGRGIQVRKKSTIHKINHICI